MVIDISTFFLNLGTLSLSLMKICYKRFRVLPVVLKDKILKMTICIYFQLLILML